MPQFSIEDYLLDNMVRLMRTNWGGGGTHLLAQELFALFGGIQRPVSQVTTTDQNGDPLVIPPAKLPSIDLGDFDPDIIDNPALPPPTFTPAPVTGGGFAGGEIPDPSAPVDGNGTRTFWKRQVFPGRVMSRDTSADNKFMIRLHRNGFEDDSVYGGNADVDFTPESVAEEDEENGSPFEAEVVITDATLAPFVAIGSWVWVFMAAQYEQNITLTAGLPTVGELRVSESRFLFHGPTFAAGLARVTETISPAANGVPGTGTATLRILTREEGEDDGEWSDGDEFTIYNSTGAEVEPDSEKLIQWKLINGLPFIDVEDCEGG